MSDSQKRTPEEIEQLRKDLEEYAKKTQTATNIHDREAAATAVDLTTEKLLKEGELFPKKEGS